MKQAKYFPACLAPMLPNNTFTGKVAFITGGGTGLGKAMTTLLCSLGANAVIVGRRKEVLESTAAEIMKETGQTVLPLPMDVRDPLAVKTTVDETVSKLGLPTLIVNNAAGNFISPFHRLSPNAWRTIIDIVLNGTAHVTMEIGKRLIAEKAGGSFLSISATYARCGSGFVVPSAAAKAGVEALMKSLACEWGQYGIRLNCIAPGPIETEGAFSRLDPEGSFKKSAIKKIPTGRLGEPMELANLASYVLSDYSSWMTGEVLTLDGGEYPMGAGEFNSLIKIKPEQWDHLEQAIRNKNKK